VAPRSRTAAELRAALGRARLQLVFTPAIFGEGGEERAFAALARALPWVDLVQVRVKDAERPTGPSPARELCAWTERVLALRGERGSPLVTVNDRVDVALALEAHGVDGVHVGADDCPPAVARRLLGPRLLLGLSTHGARDVAAAQAEPVDYLGFGPVHATATKGYGRGLGPEAAWVAARASGPPVFAIGGITPENAAELAPVGRAAVAAGVLLAADPAAAARALAGALVQGDRLLG
jgi:thiamine-phosphate pyrophosphorylase